MVNSLKLSLKMAALRYVFLDRHRPCWSHNSLIAPDDDDDDLDESLSSFFASFFQDLVLARVSSR